MPIFAVRAIRVEKLPPNPKGTAQALQRVGYTLEDALADLIDNSIDANARKVLLRFFRDSTKLTRVAIVDDGGGMDETTLHQAMQFGVQIAHKKHDLGKYGIGLKTASFSQCQTLSVFSKQNGKSNGRRWTLTRMEDDWRCEILDPQASAALFQLHWNDVTLDQHGTIVLWEDLDALASGNDIDKVTRKITKRLPVELGLRFHRFIADGRLSLQCDVSNFDTAEIAPVIIQPQDPFGYSHPGRDGYPVTFDVSLPKRGRLDLEAHIWPAKSETPEYKLGGGRVAERQGFYFYRNDRLIQGGGWNLVRESDSEPHSSLARVSIDLSSELDSAFGLTIQKSKVVPPPDFRAQVLAARCGNTSFDDYITAAVATYRDGHDEDEDELLVPGLGLPAG
ncbi:MAG TPA: ATP-binding protein, partial [Candidatus Angelobacter sp.]|nr:ATP-binding protein [Candidatus Angelobacter sp.]